MPRITSTVEPIATMGKRGILALSIMEGVSVWEGTGMATVLDTRMCVISLMIGTILQ